MKVAPESKEAYDLLCEELRRKHGDLVIPKSNIPSGGSVAEHAQHLTVSHTPTVRGESFCGQPGIILPAHMQYSCGACFVQVQRLATGWTPGFICRAGDTILYAQGSIAELALLGL